MSAQQQSAPVPPPVPASSGPPRQNRLPAETVEKRLALGFLLTLLILVAMTGIAVRNTLQSRASSDWVNQTHAVILELNAIISSLQGAESALLSYALSGTDGGLAATQKSVAKVREHFQVARTLMNTEAGQRAGFDSLEPLVNQQLAGLEEAAKLRKSNGVEAVRAVLSEPTRVGQVEALTGRVAAQIAAENERLLARDQSANSNARRTRWILYSGTALNFFLLLGGYVLVRDDLKLRRVHARYLGESNDALERRVLERTAEITKANDALQVENFERQWAVSSLERHVRHNELIINSVSEGIWVVSKPGYILRSNLAGALMTGFSHELMVGKRVHHLLKARGVGVEKADWPSHPVALAMKSAHATQNLQMELRRNDGTSLPCNCNVQPMLDSGQVVGAIICFQVASGAR